jgi:DNA-directed RNA polymerase subunit beta'
MMAKFDGKLEFDGVKAVKQDSNEGTVVSVVIGRTGEINIIDEGTERILMTNNIPYGATLAVKNGQKVKKGDILCSWDPYNNVIISEFKGKVKYEHVIEGITYREEVDEQTGHRDKVTIESRDKKKSPAILIVDEKGKEIYSYSIPVGGHIIVEDNQEIRPGEVLVKIPRILSKVRDITGGLPRVQELFEARNPSNPAKVSEIDGQVTFGKIKRGNREVTITSKDGTQKKYLVPLTKHILVQDGDFVKAGMPLSDGSITPTDILKIKGPAALQAYLVNEIQEVYRLQGVKINDKHIEVIVRRMMSDLLIGDPGDTKFLEGETVDRFDFIEQNDFIYDKKVVTDSGDSEALIAGQIVTMRQIREENSFLKRNDRKPVQFRDALPATASPLLQGITKASLGTHSWISAASFQETTKVLNQAAISASIDNMLGLKENVIVGHRIPAGTGIRDFENIMVANKKEYERSQSKKAVVEEEE